MHRHGRHPYQGDASKQGFGIASRLSPVLSIIQQAARDDWEAFEHDRVHPVVHPLLQDMLGFVPPEPPKTTLDIVDAWTAEHAQAARAWTKHGTAS